MNKSQANYDSFLDFTVSLKRDQKVQVSETVDLHVMNSVLFPDNNYFSPLPMPKEWIEVIESFSKNLQRRNGGAQNSNPKLMNFGNSLLD